jgi:hypothetical protein
MAYLMDEISEAATQRRLDEITTSGVRALEECAERSAKIDEQARESMARQEAELKAMEQERDEREREGVPAEQEQPAASVLWPTRESKPRVLSFGGEDFAEPADTPTPPAGFTEPPPAPMPPPAPEPPAPPASPREHLLSFGVDEDEATPPVPPRPAPAPRAQPQVRPDEDDEDWSNQSWVR